MAPHASPIGQSFIELQTVDSTNNYATALVHEGMAQHGTVVFAHEQTAGRGQRRNKWLTGTQNIAMSVIIQPFHLAPSQMFLISMATATAVQQLFNRYTAGDTAIKWPNDLYWRDRKAGGILIENMLSGTQWRYAVIGIGLNINQTQFNELDKQAVSLRQITGKEHDQVLLAKELCGNLQSAFEQLVQDEKVIIETYQQMLYKRGECIKLKQGNRIFHAVIKGVSVEGQLITQHAAEERFDVGDVEWIF